jgi:putative OPT family oligopeptide transporter
LASAAGTLSTIIFVLPGLVMVGWWTGFPFWQSFTVCAVGGILGVMYTVPLRRALVTESDLPYPEGVAAAEILSVGAGTPAADGVARAPSAAAIAENKTGLLAVVWGAIASAGFAAAASTRLVASEIDGYTRIGPNAVTGIGTLLSLALLGAGHLIGISVGLSMVLGLVIAWGVATPLLAALHPLTGSADVVATAIWSHQVRFIGAGAIGIAAIWALVKLAIPVTRGVQSAIVASRQRSAVGDTGLARSERDLPIGTVGIVSVACLVPLAALFAGFLAGGPLAPLTLILVGGTLLYVVIAGFLVAAACGYMAGLIGSSNSPVSGLAILSVLGAALLLVALTHGGDPRQGPTLVAYALFVTAVVLCVATIANDNLQDLKTGQLVDATPWRQQVALVIGVIFGALVIPPILDLLNRAYGFNGAPAALHPAGAQPLPAPQATLIAALAQGVIEGKLDWGLIGIGAIVGVGLIILDEGLGRSKRLRLPPLGVGIAIYLPASTNVPLILGAVAGWAYDRWASRRSDADRRKRLGVLLASGLIVGESLFGVGLAGVIVATGSATPFALVGDGFATAANVIGALAFIGATVALYRWIASRPQPESPSP